jgi:hypothetical protein
MTKKQYQVNLEEEAVKQAKIKMMDAKLSPTLNNLLKIWLQFPEEVEKLFKKLNGESNDN